MKMKKLLSILLVLGVAGAAQAVQIVEDFEGWSDGDANGDVDGDDFLIWQNQFPSPGAVANTPEPASLGLVALGGLLMLRRRRT